MGNARRRTVLTIAGLDSSGGAGITADAAAIAALGDNIAVACTAVTAQTDAGVVACHPVPPDIVAAQIDAAFAVHNVRAVKTGMLLSESIILATAGALKRRREEGREFALVVDPVLAASAGGAILSGDGLAALIEHLLPLAAAVTPNLAEAARLANMTRVDDADTLRRAAERIHAHGVQAVIITGGHLAGQPVDTVYDGTTFRELPGRRVPGMAHGSGCVYSAAFAAYLARGVPLHKAAAGAKHLATLRLRGEL